MHSESGQLDGKKIKSEDTIKEGKNIGKSNETTPEQQALLEAEARWIAKKKKTYVEKLDDAAKGKVDTTLVEGGFPVMLAQDDLKRAKYPCAGQPKLDGDRGAATGSSLWSRSRKPIRSVPHIEHALERIIKKPEKIDGELYAHIYKGDFEKIRKIVGQKKDLHPDYLTLEYHVYDIPSDKPFRERLKDMREFFKNVKDNMPIKMVETVILNNAEEAEVYKQKCLNDGYEGIMLRDLDAPYVGKRSHSLIKVKIFEDHEFTIVGAEEGRGKLQGSLGSWVCDDNHGDTFTVSMSTTLEEKQYYWDNQKDYIGKQLTVKHQGYTVNNQPRIPTGKAIRDE